ncbi:rhox homeobox family member 1-like [Peromyscus eremicus]|uniref:rhox homeobox family member 1-like n=1 Tax=Peromyscus eremicus TaxID=42410 RepID=UPI0027DCCE63|nr:rhox homeobox family member 1-like [Peromyscus eremicus]
MERHLLHVGPDEDEENWSGAKAPMVLPAGEGRNEEASEQGQPGREAAAAEGEGAGELSGEGPSAADAAGLEDGGNQEGASGGDEENEQRPQEPVHEGVGDEGVPPPPPPPPVPAPAPAPAPRCKRASSNRFAHWQRHELESVFQHTHYITADMRKQLAASMGVSEAKVQNWFKKKREQYRKYQKP